MSDYWYVGFINRLHLANIVTALTGACVDANQRRLTPTSKALDFGLEAGKARLAHRALRLLHQFAQGNRGVLVDQANQFCAKWFKLIGVL